MSNEEEKRCPLCAEEMDWTDQQFKPCKCGYQVCVWCWHQIMDLAEKEETEGRCPACRTVYEKDKIVAMQAECERDVMKICEKSKPSKAKPKTTEVKKDLTSVRVIQRKMAYIIGLPLSLADENLLQRKEYFGQYGKISKISLSRSAGGTIQQFVHETCSVYVTYSKEEEAIRCIQSVHGFVLEGRVLRASFGTAKYCHAWLKNIPCNNLACLYLHSIAPEEDSFGKDEVAAVHTRNRVQQIVGTTDNISTRCGSILPSPVEELSNGSNPCIENIAFARSSRARIHDTSYNGNLGSSNTSTSFVDIVQRPSSSCPDKDIVKSEDKISLNLGGDSSRIKVYDNNHIDDVISNPDSVQYSHIVGRPPEDLDSKEFSDDLLRDEGYFSQSSDPADFSENRNGPLVLHERNPSSSNISTDQNSSHSFEEESLSLLNENNELKFQSTAKSDEIYRNSNLFSTDEIVEHLRRISDNSLCNDEELSSFDVVESSIISNILSMGFDSCDDSMTLPHGLNDELDDRHASSWSGKSGFSFAKEDGFGSQLSNHQCLVNNHFGQVSRTCSIGKDHTGCLDQYASNPRYQAPMSPSFAPPGFSLPFREAVPPPGFSLFDNTGRVQLSPSSAGGLVKNTCLPNGYFQTPAAGNNGNNIEVDFYDPAILSCGKGKPTNGLENTVFGPGPRPIFNTQQSSFKDQAQYLLLMQQQHQQQQQQQPLSHHNQDLLYSGNYSQQTYNRVGGGGLGNRQLSKVRPPNSFDVMWEKETCVGAGVGTDIQRNGRLGLENYFNGYYGDLGFQMSGSDLYSRGFF